MIVGIHQPNFMPWLGYFYKIAKSDIFVILDDVQYTKNSFINRNKVKTPQGPIWHTVPVLHKFGDNINEVLISNKADWRKKHLKTLELNYKKARFFNEIMDHMEKIYFKKEWNNLADFNIDLIEFVNSYVGIDTKMVKSSEINAEGKSTDLLIDIIKKLHGDTYLSGTGGANYQEEEKYTQSGIKLVYSSFKSPEYNQLWGEFTPNLSIIDVLFNCEPKAIREFLK